MRINKSTELIDTFSLDKFVEKNKPPTRRNKKLDWWRASKFGMFIHWGVYSKIAGEWKGSILPSTHIGEWIMCLYEISIHEYEAVAKDFNPTKYDARQWVRLIKAAGMKYVIITAKHHEGFAMYKSQASHYNIVDFTPYDKDPLKDLADACHEEGIKFCIYYSHMIDFHHPHGARNDWCHPNRGKKEVSKYLEEKCIPQIRELLTQYGMVDMIWFDMPESITFEQAKEIKSIVEDLQPDCIIGGRLGQELEEYISAGDNEYPQNVLDYDWEAVGTMNDTWGYKKHDHNWKSTKALLRLLIHIVARGGNYVLNVGPTEEGLIPTESQKRLKEMGQWLQVNGEAIYDSHVNPFSYNPSWGEMTTKERKIYLHVFDNGIDRIQLHGLISKVNKAYILGKDGSIEFEQRYDKETNCHLTQVKLPQLMNQPLIPVVVLELNEEPIIQKGMLQDAEGKVILTPLNGQLHRSYHHSQVLIEKKGVAIDWNNEGDYFQWEFNIIKPGKYDLEMVTMSKKYNKVWNGEWEGGHLFQVDINEHSNQFLLTEDRRFRPEDLYYYDNIGTSIGVMDLKEVGTYKVTLSLKEFNKEAKIGLTFCHLSIKPSIS